MVNIPIRSIGELGVIPDFNDHDLPVKAWNAAVNLRFDQGFVSRYSVFRPFAAGYDLTGVSNQVTGIFEAGGGETDSCVVTVMQDGTLRQRLNGVTTFPTPAGTLGNSTVQPTVTKLASVTYLNRPSDVPVYRSAPSDGSFVAIPGWDSNDRCSSLRSYKDFLVAMDVTKSGTSYPTMFKWSNAALSGSPPADWDVLDLSSLAGETTISDCDDKLVDGLALGNSFIVYGQTQTFRVDFIGAPLVFSFDKLFNDQGVMARNCVVEAENKHFVFGRDDIYVHDGITKQSIADGRVLKTIFEELDMDKRDRCFVYHDQVNREVAFCYVSLSSESPWQHGDVVGCNKAWVYNYRSNTWYPVDLPSLIGWTSAANTEQFLWSDMPIWRRARMTWDSMRDDKPRTMLVLSSGNPSLSVDPQAVWLDLLDGGQFSTEPVPEMYFDAWGEWRYKDLDELGAPIYGRKQINYFDLQFGALDSDNQIGFQVGQSKGANTPITWLRKASVDPWDDFRYNTRVNDRYIAMRLELPEGSNAIFGGFDMDVIQIAGR